MAAIAIGTMILTNNPHYGMTVTPRAAITSTNYKMRAPYQLKQGQSRHFHKLPSGSNMEIIFQKGHRKSDQKPPLVFVHGSFHAAWCWAEHWLPFFSRHGFDCYALSLLAQGESDSPDGAVAGSLQSHAADVADFIHQEIQFPPVLLGHSFGGLIVQYYVANVGNEKLREIENTYPYLAGAVLVCSVPPSGNSGLVWRYLFSKPIAAFKVTRSLAAKAFQTSLPLCKETFFSADMEDHLVLRYQKLMTESSRKPLFDLRKLNASLPVPPMKDPSLKILVLGANDDFIVDAEGLNETGRFYGVSPVCVEGVAHDMMLDCSWEKGAETILSWLHALN
ncbi:alpha/beta-Hydrolases superfamily protein [Perilla frutescens var. hirtella]|uniref:Alpha/beta-Hydrolases superfamily protein n=1 Tax=Perilla frutescens var. hirtella TaxID=608512 RepID=A0AAD4P4G0_PERFH|nr:alpha/beta-Hydrolases superfamily protein [Perilla frutescens var. hirtella]